MNPVAVREIVSPDHWAQVNSLGSSAALEGTNSLGSQISGSKSYRNQRNLFAIKNLVKQGGKLDALSNNKKPNNLAIWNASSRSRVAQLISTHRSEKAGLDEKNLPERTKFKIRTIGQRLEQRLNLV